MKMKSYTFAIFCIVLFSLPACSSEDSVWEVEIIDVVEKGDSVPISSNTKDGDSSSASRVFKMEPFFPLRTGGGVLEGAALYGDYVFHATAGNAIHIYNIREQKYVTMLKMGTMGHADTVCFGVQKVDESDEFPVLYVSGSQSNSVGRGGEIYVYRIERLTDENGKEKWKGTLIQHILTPDVSIVGSFPDVVIDQENRCLWMMGWLTAYEYNKEDGSGCTNCFSKYSIPEITSGKQDAKGVYQLTLTEEERLSYFLVNDIHAITQGLCFCRGKIICPYGMPTVSFKGIDVVDVSKQSLIYHVNLKGSKIGEPEAAVVYDNNLYILGQGDFVYKCSGIEL